MSVETNTSETLFVPSVRHMVYFYWSATEINAYYARQWSWREGNLNGIPYKFGNVTIRSA